MSLCFVVGGKDLLEGLFDVPVPVYGFLQGGEVRLDGFPVVVLLGGDVDAVPFGGLVGFFVQEEFLVELFAGAEACADDFFLAGAVEADHLFGQVFDPDGLAHIGNGGTVLAFPLGLRDNSLVSLVFT